MMKIPTDTSILRCRKSNGWFLALLVAVIIFGCKPKVPDEYVQQNEMEEILYEYQLAMAYAKQTYPAAPMEEFKYRMAVLKNHGINQKKFDRSMEYYMRHSKILAEMYDHVSKRINQEAVKLGAEADGGGIISGLSQHGDTADVWTKNRSCILVPQTPFNVRSFEIKADSSYRKGDEIILSFNTKFIVQDGMRDGTAVIAVRFKNDSVACNKVFMNSAYNYQLRVADTEKQGIKEIRGYFIYNSDLTLPQNKVPSTVTQILSIYDIQLIRIHQRATFTQKPDSLQVKKNDLQLKDTTTIHSQSTPSLS